MKSCGVEMPYEHPKQPRRATRGKGTHIEVEDFPRDHHGEELFRGGWESAADRLANVHGDFGNSLQLLLALLHNLVRTGDWHDVN